MDESEPELDEVQQRGICAVLAVGGDRQTAARYIGCSADAIRKTAEVDPEFEERMKRAESDFEIFNLSNIQQAGKKSWHASAWILERVHPERFGKRGPLTIPITDLKVILTRFAEAIRKEVANEELSNRLVDRLDKIVAKLTADAKKKAKK